MGARSGGNERREGHSAEARLRLREEEEGEGEMKEGRKEDEENFH